MRYTIHQIAQIIAPNCKVSNSAEISQLLTDSRSLSDPDETLFFALETIHNDGHKYIKSLYEKGVRQFVVHHLSPEFSFLKDATILLVNDTLVALQQLAIFHRNKFSIPIIGITGSNGKTIVKEWLYQLLNKDFNIVRSPRSYNSQIGVPLSIWEINEKNNLGIFEAGISMASEMIHLEPIIRPTIGLITNIGEAHQENFSSLETKCLEKLKLFQNSDILIYDSDDTLINKCILSNIPYKKIRSWSRKDPNAWLYICGIEKQTHFTRISYSFSGIHDEIDIPFVDDASIENSIHCLAISLYLKPQTNDLQVRFANLEPVAMRLDVKKGSNNCILINDTYNSDINSLDIALDFMQRRSLDKKMKSVLILSDIVQSGIPADIFYKRVAELLEKKQVHQIIGIGNDLIANADKFQMEKEFYLSTEDLLHSGYLSYFHNAIILIKGSRSFQFEKISEQLEEKAHETTLEVNLDAIIHNYKYIRSKLKPSTKVISMVKAFGYGVGSYELAKTLQDQGCDFLAVAVVDEGAELRKEGITMPILVMNPEMHSFSLLFQNNLEPEIYSFRILEAIIRESERRGITYYPVHIKINTGMNRLGFDLSELPQLVTRLKSQQGIKVRSVFSHLAGSDSAQFDDYTHQQLRLFKQAFSVLEESLGYHFMKHILNSGGIERFSEYQYDIVRLGIGLYGVSAIDQSLLMPVATLKTTILQIRNVKKGETVGYNRKGIITKDSKIACLPIGYADGLDRKLGNQNGKVSINGVFCPIIGNICMDMCMVDVTDAHAKEGDPAIIFGKEISISELAQQLETIPYEILTSISPRVKRVYFKE